MDFGESDRILTLLTESLGMISVLAKGARKSNRRFGGALESFALFEAVLGHKRGSLWPLAEATLLDPHAELARDLKRVEAAAFVLKLVRELSLEQQPSLRLFSLVQEALALIAGLKATAIEAAAIAAALRILSLAGFAMAAAHCNACGKPVPQGKKVLLNPARGGVVCTPCGGGPIVLSREAAEALSALSTLPLSSTPEIALSGCAAEEVKSALIGFLDYHLGARLHSPWLR